MARYRNYSDEDKAVALAYYDACNNVEMTARECRVPASSLRDWIRQRDSRDEHPSQPPTEFVAEKRACLADRLEELAHAALGQARGAIGDASAQQAATVMGIAVDKMRLLREQATSISAQQPVSVEERDRRALELIERGKLRLVNGGGGG